MKKAIVFYLWGMKNAGDMAICLGTISLLQELGYEITFISRFAEGEESYIESKKYINKYYNNINIEPGVFTLNRNDSKLKILRSYFKGMAKTISPVDDKRIKKLILESDVVFLNGGNILRGNSFIDYARLMALFYPFHISQHLDKPMICLPQSTAKSSRIGLRILQNKLEKFETVFIRENISFSILDEKLNNVFLKKSTDLAFFLKDSPIVFDEFNEKYETIINKKEKSIALIFRGTTIGDLKEFNFEKKNIIAKNIVKFIEEFKNDYKIYFVIQTKKDKGFTKYIKQMVDTIADVTLIEEYDPYVIREIYKHMDFIVAMRLHAAILAMSTQTPVIGYFDKSWGYKNPGIMKDVGMPCTTDGNELMFYGHELISKRSEYTDKIKEFIDFERDNIINIFNESKLE